MKINESIRLLELDALRGIAAIAVVCFHLGISYQEESHKFFNLGVTGVDLFFIISGFVILMTLEKTQTSKDFIISRISRLYPAYWVCVTLTALLMILVGKIKPELAHSGLLTKYLVNLTMFQRWFDVVDLDGSYWTLNVELIFYTLMLAVFVMKQLKNIEYIGFSVLISIVIIQVFSSPPIIEEIPAFVASLYKFMSYYSLFYAGILLYRMKTVRITVARYILVILCLTVQYALFGKSRSIYISSEQYGLMLLIYGSLFLLFINNNLKFIVNKVTIFLGGISYSLYLVHEFLSIGIIVPILTAKAHLNFWIASYGLALPICIIIAAIINSRVEQPVMAAIRSIYRSKKICRLD